MFDIFLDAPAKKFIRKLDTENKIRILEAIEKLAEDPIPHDAKKVYGTDGKAFRIRKGDFRILYRINYGKVIIIVFRIDSRKRVYKNL